MRERISDKKIGLLSLQLPVVLDAPRGIHVNPEALWDCIFFAPLKEILWFPSSESCVFCLHYYLLLFSKNPDNLSVLKESETAESYVVLNIFLLANWTPPATQEGIDSSFQRMSQSVDSAGPIARVGFDTQYSSMSCRTNRDESGRYLHQISEAPSWRWGW